jgi:hypothetical protein
VDEPPLAPAPNASERVGHRGIIGDPVVAFGARPRPRPAARLVLPPVAGPGAAVGGQLVERHRDLSRANAELDEVGSRSMFRVREAARGSAR